MPDAWNEAGQALLAAEDEFAVAYVDQLGVAVSERVAASAGTAAVHDLAETSYLLCVLAAFRHQGRTEP